ncbi:hypothetical protein C1H46_024461 [Malus baccata]|uniref:Uncharacterized protein n=1 Tax=Malus baccata TaxID=106549 RepID=A0A540LU37_MALBA|nr:hypothetical protein C1H46_024461 [Malus baccata]
MLAAGEFTDRHSRLGPSIPRVLTILSFVLEKLVARNNTLVDDLNHQLSGISCGSAVIGKSLDVFHGVRPPSISIPKYLERLYKLLVTSVMVASKMLDDVYRKLHRAPHFLKLWTDPDGFFLFSIAHG